MPQQNTNAQQPAETHVIASPNPTIDDSKTRAVETPPKVEAARIKPASATTTTPMKTTKKSKKHRRQKR